MITHSSIAFEDFLGSSIAPQVMPPCDEHKSDVTYDVVVIFLPFLFSSVSIISIFPQVYTSLTDTSTVVRKIIQTAITVGKTFCPTKTLETKTHVKQNYIDVKLNLFDHSGLQRTLVGSLPALHGQVSEALRGAGLCLR